MDAFSVPAWPDRISVMLCEKWTDISSYVRDQCSLTKMSFVQLCVFPFYNKVCFVFHSEEELPVYDRNVVEEKVSPVLCLYPRQQHG